MIKFVNGNLFESKCEYLVNTVNTVGVMGKGIALKFKELYPDMYNRYRKFCEEDKLSTGSLMIYKSDIKNVLCFPTKEHWRSPSKLEYIEKGLEKFVNTYKEKGIKSIAFPMLGCGNGNLDWNDVKPIMIKYLDNLEDLEVEIYESNISTSREHIDVESTMQHIKKTHPKLTKEKLIESISNKNKLNRTLFDLSIKEEQTGYIYFESNINWDSLLDIINDREKIDSSKLKSNQPSLKDHNKLLKLLSTSSMFTVLDKDNLTIVYDK